MTRNNKNKAKFHDLMKRYIGLAALVISISVMGCAATHETATPIPARAQMPTQQHILTDFMFLPAVQVKAKFAAFIGPGIWEYVPAHGRTHEGAVEYLVEALNSRGNIVAAFNGRYQRPKPDFAGENPALSELVTILIAIENQMKNAVPNEFAANPRYAIPLNAAVLRITIDPRNKVAESDEDNNVTYLTIPEFYKEL